MKLLIHSNSPTVPTGYGVQTALLVDRLVSAGHEVAVSCTWGHQVGVTLWESPSGHKVRLYPAGATASSIDVLHGHAKHWFDGNRQAGWIIPLLDMWSLVGNPELQGWNIAPWTPVDHDPVPANVLRFFAEHPESQPVAMSRFGEAQLRAAGLDPLYVPLAVDTKVYRPTWTVPAAAVPGTGKSSRAFFGLPDGAFVVGMVGMNKDPNDRKGFQEAFQAFARFQRGHPEAVLLVHTEASGIQGGLNLPRLAAACGVREGTWATTDQYGYRLGFPPEIMAALYTAMDVLLAPSAGEGFCVPLIEAQACGTPVIASNFTAQPELVGAGWLVEGQLWWDEASRAWYVRPDVNQIVARLESAHELLSIDADAIGERARTFAGTYDADYVFDAYWRPALAALDLEPPADKEPMGDVAVLVPVLSRPENVRSLVESFTRWNDGTAWLYFVVDPDDDDEIAAIDAATADFTYRPWIVGDRGSTFAQKVNAGFAKTTERWVCIVGDDVEFTPGWLAAARARSDRYDVIGTNDANPGEVRNPHVADGSHADHFFVRRSYVDEHGGCLDGPGVLAPEAYHHYFTDREIVGLARARGVYTPCLDARVIHHQPRYEGRPEEWDADPVYVKGGVYAAQDERTYRRRVQLIEQQRTPRRVTA
jgi:glycosyltransferase involved in cell wall biosynthesis